MKKLNLIWIFVLLLSSLVIAEDVYVEVSLHLTPDQITATDVQLYQGLPQDYLLDYPEYYVGKVYSFKDELLYEFNFEKSFYVYDLGEIDEDYETISFPHFRNMARLEVWDGREKKLDLDLSDYATCNENDFCDSFENERTCPEDCSDAFKEESGIQESLEKQEESLPSIPKEEQNNNGVYYVIIIAIVVILFVLFLLIISRKKQKHF